MKTVLVAAVLVLVSQAHAYSSGRYVSVDVKENNTTKCEDCLKFFTDIQEMLESGNTSAQLEQLCDQMVCSQLGDFEGMCKQLVQQFVPMALQYIAQMEAPRQVCGLIGFCTQEALKRVTLPVQRKPVRGEECDMCKTAVNELKDVVRNPQYQAMIKDFLENNVCALLGSLADECKQEVESYAAMVFELLENELDPVAVCQYLGLCTKTKTVSLSRVGLASSATKVKVLKAQKKVEDSTTCDLCEFAIKGLTKILGNNRTQAEIEAALDKLCDALPASFKEQCTAFVDEYGPEIVQLLMQELDPKVVCTQLGLCTSTKKMTAPTPTCVLCEFAMTEVDKLIANNKSQANIEAALQKLCSMMPVTISAECKDFVKDFGPAIINLLVQELEPKDVCKTLRLCTGTKATKALKMTPLHVKKLSATPQCILCEFVMKELDTLLADNATEQDIQAALDKVCSLLPSTIQDQCSSFVDQYAPAILQLLVQELEPESICTLIGVCSQTKFRKATPLKWKLQDEKCDFCIIIFNYLDELLKENATTQDVENALGKVCNFLGSQLQDECNTLVKQFAPLIIDLIANDLNTHVICEELKLCNATRKTMEQIDNKLYFKADMVGKNKCTFGPSYWCASKENAERCGAMDHCRKHVWN